MNDSQPDLEARRSWLAYFGVDVETPDLKAFVEARGTLLALDTEGVRRALEADLPFQLIDDWLSPEDRASVVDVAAEGAAHWFEPYLADFTFEGVVWPRVDASASDLFWTEMTSALHLRRALGRAGPGQLCFHRGHRSIEKVYFSASDICAYAWADPGNPDGIPQDRRRPPPRQTLHGWLQPWVRAVRRFTGTAGPFGSAQLRRQLGDKVVIVGTPSETQRHTPMVMDLSRHLPGRLCALLTETTSPTEAKKVAALWGVPTFANPVAASCRPARLQFEAALASVRANHDGERGRTLANPHFDHLARTRWPKLVGLHRFYRDAFAQARPAALLVSTLPHAENQVPAAAAQSLGIPTIGLPHAGVQTGCGTTTDFVLASNELQVEQFGLAGIAPEHIRRCAPVLGPEYRATAADWPAEGRTRILGIMGPLGRPKMLLPAPLRSHVEGIATLSDLNQRFGDRLSVRFKPHPSHPEAELFDVAHSKASMLVAEPTTSLEALLDCCDIAVILNYWGTGVMRVALAGKPALLYWSDQTPALHRLPKASFMPLAPLINTPEQLSTHIHDFIDNSATRQQMAERSRRFAEDRLADFSEPRLTDLLDEIL